MAIDILYLVKIDFHGEILSFLAFLRFELRSNPSPVRVYRFYGSEGNG